MLEISFTRYLEAKRSVDDRALNNRVWNRLGKFLAGNFDQSPVQILDIGAGTGAMLRRLTEEGWLRRANYHGFDEQAENIACAWENTYSWAGVHDFPIQPEGGRLCLTTPGGWLGIFFEQSNLTDFIEKWRGRKSWDVVLANAFLDLVNIPLTLPSLLPLTYPGGIFCFTINFDGLTILEPVVDARFDDLILSLYHRTMDERITDGQPSGDSRAGRHLFTQLPEAGYEILEAGSSDWVVYATDGEYPGDEAYFLQFMLHFIEEALRGCPELDGEEFSRWLAARRQQILRGELVLVAHQLDFLARRPPA